MPKGAWKTSIRSQKMVELGTPRNRDPKIWQAAFKMWRFAKLQMTLSTQKCPQRLIYGDLFPRNFRLGNFQKIETYSDKNGRLSKYDEFPDFERRRALENAQTGSKLTFADWVAHLIDEFLSFISTNLVDITADSKSGITRCNSYENLQEFASTRTSGFRQEQRGYGGTITTLTKPSRVESYIFTLLKG